MSHVQSRQCRSLPVDFIPNRLCPAPTEDEIRQGFADWFLYLGEPPAALEKDIRKRSIDESNTQRRNKILSDVITIVSITHSLLPGVFSNGVKPSVLVETKVAESVIDYLRNDYITPQGKSTGRKGVGADRLAEFVSVFKKMVCYICVRQQRNSGVLFTLDRIDSWQYISSISTDAARSIITKRCNEALPSVSHRYMTIEEMLKVRDVSLQTLTDILAQSKEDNFVLTHDKRRSFHRHLLVSMILLCLAPRSQTLSELTERDIFDTQMSGIPPSRTFYEPGHPVNPHPNCWYMSIPAQKQKNRKAYTSPVPSILTESLNFYRSHIHKPNQEWFFMTETGHKNYKGLAKYTKCVTKNIIGRPIVAHKFRHAIKHYFDKQGLDKQQRQMLLMSAGHDLNTSDRHYGRYDVSQNQLDFAQMLLNDKGSKAVNASE
jgi:hypothetical protein